VCGRITGFSTAFLMGKSDYTVNKAGTEKHKNEKESFTRATW
jgi:hypothetical protein